jgi:hypothetical protein
MKYKVGDRVRVRRDLVVGRIYGGLDCLQPHKKECGKIFTIMDSEEHDYHLNGSGYWWSEEMLEEVDEMGKTVMRIEIISDGKNVRAILGQKVAIAKCSPEDEFDLFIGAKLALERLEEKCSPYPWLKDDIMYYIPDLHRDSLYRLTEYNHTEYDERMKKRGLVFRTKKEAIEAAKKMLEAVVIAPCI